MTQPFFTLDDALLSLNNFAGFKFIKTPQSQLEINEQTLSIEEINDKHELILFGLPFEEHQQYIPNFEKTYEIVFQISHLSVLGISFVPKWFNQQHFESAHTFIANSNVSCVFRNGKHYNWSNNEVK